MKAEMELTILEVGTISIVTGNMAGEHHASADKFIMLVHQLAGGAARRMAFSPERGETVKFRPIASASANRLLTMT